MKRWVVADTHFGHKMLVAHGYRPPDFSRRIIDQWIRWVHPDDLVIHLGDVALPDKAPEVWTVLAELPGRKVLVRGNHDKRSATWYMKRGFSLACDALELGGILFTHEPRLVVPDHINFNLHGHLHEGNHRPFTPGPKHRLVAIERTGYAPIQVEKAVRQ